MPGVHQEFRLLAAFERLFQGRVYRHRVANQGDLVAVEIYEDLVSVGRSNKLLEAVHGRTRAVNVSNLRRGINARRGDATFGQVVPGADVITDAGYMVPRGSIATIEIGLEVKILAKAMIKQIDRVIGDLRRQADEFRRRGGNPICVAIVGVNWAEKYVSYEGRRKFPTTGKGGFLHPCQEAPEAEERLVDNAQPAFDEFVIIRFQATNSPPYPFEWKDYRELRLDYGAALARISNLYQQRF